MKKKLSVLLAAVLLLTGCATDISNVPVIADVPITFVSETERAAADEEPENTSTLAVEQVPETEPMQKFPPDYAAFDSVLADAKDKYQITGLTAALFKDGEILYVKSLGYADVENEIPCTENTRYRVASVSKLVSTIALMTLYDKNVISPGSMLSDATGIEYDDPRCKEQVRLWHLLTHTAGIVDTYEYDSVATYMYTPINSLLPSAHLGCEPGTMYSYSNFGAGSIGAIIEKLTQEHFYDYAGEALFEPLGMDAGYVIDKIADKESCAKLYDHDGEIFDVKNWGRSSSYYDKFGLGNSYYVAQCELIITAPDLARIGMIMTDGGTSGDVRILSEEAVELMHRRWFEAEDFDMGLNVRIYDDLVDGRTIYGHPGNALGVITGLFYDPSDRTGIVFLTNHCLANTDENGFYKANKAALLAAYEYIFDRNI